MTQSSEKRRAYDQKPDVKARAYGMTTDEYAQLLGQQGGVCAICKYIERSRRRLSVDHDHRTQKVRSLLCSSCNILLGHARESVDILVAAISYLEKHRV